MHIFEKAQSVRPANSSGMNQYVNESSGPVQVNNYGDYINPQQAVVIVENSHIRRALRSGSLREVFFEEKQVLQEAKTPKRSKKTEETIIETQLEPASELEADIKNEPTEEVVEDSAVVATEPIEL